jgi:hypothetical protein
MRRRYSVITGSVGWVLAALLCQALTFAGGTDGRGAIPFSGPNPNPTVSVLPWSNETVYQECGQSCLQHKANELLTLQASTMEAHLFALKQAYEAALTKGDYTEIRGELNSYCADLPSSTTDQSSAKKCLLRYVRFQLPFFRRIQNAIAANNDAVLHYRSDVATIAPDGTIRYSKGQSPFQVSVDSNEAKRPQTPYLPTQKELKDQYDEEQKKLRNLTSPKFNDWVQQEQSKIHLPNESDFYLWKQFEADPANPGAGKGSVLLRDANGKPLVDKVAFGKALSEYTAAVASLNKELPETKTPGPQGETTKPLASDAYEVARTNLVNQINTGLKKNTDGIQTFPAPVRVPAQASGPTLDQTAPMAGHQLWTTSFGVDQLETEITKYEKWVDDLEKLP